MTSNIATKATPNNPFIGKTLGAKYTIERLIGRGGMGLVHLATELDGGREVVIKMLAPHFAEDDSAVARFEREGRRLAQLFHPNIVELYDLGWDEDQSYIVMEYIDGEPLRHHLGRKGRLTLDEFAPIAAQVLSAVAVAHEQKMMLRDIKPSNIMLCEQEGKSSFVKMLDFGLAKLVDGDDVEVTKAHVIGTAGYLAPEQIKGEPTDLRVDVYALGILFFVMLAGRSPVLGENDGAVLYNHVHGEPLRLETTLPDGHAVPDNLIALIHRCMEKSPARRPSDAKALAEELRECLPAEKFELPGATPEAREAVEAYKNSKRRDNKEPHGVENSSSEWTRPHLRKLLEDGTLAEIRNAKPSDGPPKPPTPPPQPPSSPRKAKKTVMGLAPAGSAPKPPPRRPPPAKMPASASMEHNTGERRTLSPLQKRRVVVRPKPRSLVKAEEAAIPEIEIEPDDPPSAAETINGLPLVEVDTTPHGRARSEAGDATPSHAEATPGPGGKPRTEVVGSAVSGRTQIGTTAVTEVPAKSGYTETGVPAVPIEPGSVGQTEPQHEPIIDEALELDASDLISEPVPVQRRAAPSADLFGAALTDEPGRPAWVYALSGVLAVLIITMIGYLFATTDDVPPTSQVADAETPVTPTASAAAADAAEPVPTPIANAGELRVEADAASIVFVDEQRMGPGAFVGQLQAGTHKIRVERDGFVPFEIDVDLTVGGNEAVLVEMDPLPEPATSTPEPTTPSPPLSGTKRPKKPKTTKPLPKKAPPKTKPNPISEPTPKAEPKPAPKSEPKPKSDGGDDLFIDAPKKKKKGSGIFLPVGE